MDLTPCDFYLWETLKNKVYAGNSYKINEFKDNIISTIELMSAEELLKLNNNFIR